MRNDKIIAIQIRHEFKSHYTVALYIWFSFYIPKKFLKNIIYIYITFERVFNSQIVYIWALNGLRQPHMLVDKST